MIPKTTATWLAILTLSVCVLSTGASKTQKNTSQIVVELSHRLDYARTDFNHAYTMVWAGEVNFGGKKVGEFTATMTKTTRTGQNGAITQYDILIPESGPIAEFFSVRTNHIVTGAGSDHGLVFAASPKYKFLIGAAVQMEGAKTTIEWSEGQFPRGSPLSR